MSTQSELSKNKKSVAVIGAGFTGLTTAYRLVQKGYNVTLFEKNSTIGGLVDGFTLDGHPLEKAYHFLYKTDSAIIELAEELGVANTLHFHDSSLSLYYDGKLWPFMTPLDLLKFKPLSFVNRLRAGLVAVYLQKAKKWKQFANISAYDWMRKWAGKKVTKVIWEPILRGKFFHHWDTIEMSYVWSRVHVRANSKKKGDVTEQLGYFDGGFKTFIDALACAFKKNGGVLKTDVSIESIISDKNNQVAITVDGHRQMFDKVVATVPTRVFAKLISKDEAATVAYMDHLRSVDYLGAVTMVIDTKQNLSPYYWHNINDINHPFLVMLSLTALVGQEKYDGKNIYYIGAYLPHDHRYFDANSDDVITEDWFKGVSEVFPHFDKNQINSTTIFKLPYAQHVANVGYQSKIPSYQTPLKNVFLANFSQIYPDDRGTNYAVLEGNKIANMVDADMSLTNNNK